jgi:hypothetical protein
VLKHETVKSPRRRTTFGPDSHEASERSMQMSHVLYCNPTYMNKSYLHPTKTSIEMT